MLGLDPMMRSHLPGSSMLHAVQLLLERGGLAGAAEHGLEVAHGGRAAGVAEGSGADQLKGGRSQAVVGHKDGRDVRGDEAARAVDAGLQGVFVGTQIEDQNIAVSGSDQGIHRLAVGLEQDLEVFTKGRRKKRLQRAVFGVQPNSRHARSVIQLAGFAVLLWCVSDVTV
jgi:hypothetical protein